MTSKTEGRSPVTSRTEEDKVAAVKREEIERCFGFNSDDSMQSNNSNEEDTQSRERYVRSGGDKVSIRLDGDKVSMRSGGDKVSIRLDGDKVSMTSDGDKVSVRSGGDKVSIRSGGDKESVRSGGVKEFIRSGGDKESVRSDGDKESVRSGGVKESIRSGGDKESVRSGGDKVSMRSGGDKESVRSDGDKESIRSGGDKKGEYISSGVHNKEEENMNLACERSEQDKIFRSQSPAIDDMFCCKDVETEGDLHVTPVASTSSSASHCEVGQPSRDLEQTWKGGHISVASGHRGETKPHTAVQDKTDSDHKDVECIDILSDAADDDEDDDEEETSVASKKATDSDLLYLRLKNLPGKNVPTVCQKCRNIWNDRVLNIISLGTESVTVNSRITYGAIICINNWAESHFSSGKEEAVRSLLDRADLGKNIGSLKISEVNHWLGNIMKSGKIKCCHVFTAVYKPDSTKEFLSNLIGADVTSDVVPVRNNKRDAPVTHEEEIPAKKRISEVKKKTKTKNLNKILRKPLKSTGTLSSSQKVQPSCSKYIPTVSEDVEPASEKIMLSGAWDTPMFAETITMPEVSKEVEAVSLETKKSSSESGPALVSESPVETPPKETVRPVIQSPKMNESDLPEECTPSTSEKSVPLLSKETTPSISKRNKLSLSNNKLQLKLPRHVPPSTKTTALPVSETATLSVSKNVTSPLSENQTSHEPEKDKSNTLSTTETSTTENMETIQPACETTSTTALTENTVTTPIKRTSKLKCHIPKIKTLKPSTSENNRELGASTRQTRSSTSSSQQPPLSQDASDSFPSISSQQDAVAAAVSTVEADNLTKESLVTSHESILSNDDKILTTDTNKPAQAVSQQVVPSTISPQHSLIESQNSTKTIVDTADENSISSDTDIGGEGEEDKSVPSEENTGNNLCAVLGLNVNTLDTYCSSTDMKTITNGGMVKHPSKKYKYSFSHYEMLKERSALCGLAREAFDLLPFESDNCRPLTPGTRGRRRFLTNRELLMLQNICILNPESPDVDLLFRILIQILLTRKRVLLVPNSLTLLLVAENLRRDFNRAKSKGTYSIFLSQDWDPSNIYTAEDLWLSKLELTEGPTIRNIISVFCLWKNLEQHLPNVSLPEAVEELCRNINLRATDKTQFCIKLYTRFCSYLYEEKNRILAEFFLNQPLTESNPPKSRKQLINAMMASLDMTDLSSAGSLNGAEKEVQSAEQKCVTAEKAALQSPDFQKKEELRVNLTIFKEKLSKYKEMNDMMLKRIKLAENRKQEIVNKFVDSKSKKLVQKLSETRRAIHQSLAKRKGDGSMENVENSKKALKVDYTKNIRSSTEICSRERFSSVAASIDLGEDVPQTVREGIYELLANGVDVNQVRTVVHTILTKVGGEESPALPSVSWIRNFARLNGFMIK
ncbi:uncharacterized protein LOC121853653 isoform X3 [Homarus americanus]|uniref:uncharacterized protein LOC121853653 isoform X3 n=1 Tax=Homarus americanus TaxID=6706 RepID=UPI001C44401E|nr:uncharacterized protein LOC121853653 isoform X3 [Homarus americanus]